MVKELKKNETQPDTGVSWNLGTPFNLRLLIHYVGDMHQPLHTVSRFTPEYPDGDMGGNLFPLQEKDGINELHALWDSTLYEWDEDFGEPLTEEGWNKLGEISNTLRWEHSKYDLDMAAYLKKPESQWAEEGYALATAFVYKIQENTLPSDDYLNGCRDIVHKQLALGGYRLAKLLTQIYKDEVKDQRVLDQYE